MHKKGGHAVLQSPFYEKYEKWNGTWSSKR